MKPTSLVEDFQEYFDVCIAGKGSSELEDVYRIRYRVYCEEFKYEPIDAFPLGQEVDAFDDSSIHCLITHKSSGMPAGCVRVVTVDDSTLMPMEKYCAESFDQALMSRFSENRGVICEFSRLAVDGAFRRRTGEHASRFGELNALDISLREARTFSLISVSAFLSAFAVSDLIGRRHCFAMMEPFLPRMLARSGIVVSKLGFEVDYHGLRAPYFIRTEDAVGGMLEELQEFYRVLRARFAEHALFTRHQRRPAAARSIVEAGRSLEAWLDTRVPSPAGA